MSRRGFIKLKMSVLAAGAVAGGAGKAALLEKSNMLDEVKRLRRFFLVFSLQ